MSIFGNDPVHARVKAGDLARFDDIALASLDASRQALLRTHLAVAEARLASRQARDDHERVAARTSGARADVKLAKAELTSARAHSDAQGSEEAAHSVAAAQTDKAALDRHIAWLRAEVAAAEAREEEVNAAAWAAEADYEMARARLLASDRPPGEANLQAFVKQSEACLKASEDARRRSVRLRAEADTQRSAWQQARGPVLERV